MATQTDRRKRITTCASCIVLLALVASCSQTPDNLVVLLPEDDGTVGKVSVTTASGTTTLDTAGAATGLDSATAAPGKVFRIETKRINSIFESAIAAQPTPPVSFILYFRTGKTRMTASSRGQWSNILAEIRRRKSPDIGIVGHTDRAGPDAYNEPLSRRRAAIIQKRLVKAGIEPGIIDISWHGENNPIVQTPDGINERRNRRVELIVR